MIAGRTVDESAPQARAPAPGCVCGFPLPPTGFDPETADDDALRRYGLPLVSEMAGNPQASAFRRAFLQRRAGGPPLRFLQAMRAAGLPGPGVRASVRLTGPALRSVNWSGGCVTPRDGRSLVSVMGAWTAPAVSAPPGGTDAEYRSSTWLGLDGQSRYLDSSLPQIGTLQRWINGPAAGAEYSAWFQWWSRGRDEPPFDLTLEVAAGDEIRAIIVALDDTTVLAAMRNVTQDTVTTLLASAPQPCRISGASAQWIMERPSPMGADGWGAYPLPAYAPFSFSQCVAESLAPGRSALLDHPLDDARLIQMYELTPPPARIRTISTAQREDQPPPRLALRYGGP